MTCACGHPKAAHHGAGDPCGSRHCCLCFCEEYDPFGSIRDGGGLGEDGWAAEALWDQFCVPILRHGGIVVEPEPLSVE